MTQVSQSIIDVFFSETTRDQSWWSQRNQLHASDMEHIREPLLIADHVLSLLSNLCALFSFCRTRCMHATK